MTEFSQTQKKPMRANSFWGLPVFLLLCVAGLFAYANLDTFRELWYYWIEGYNWQFVVPVAFVYMLWDRRDLYAGLSREPSILPGAVLLAGGCALLVIGQLSSTHSLREVSIVINVFGLVLLLFGGKYVRKLFWPLIYLVLMTSLTSDLLEYLRYPLKLISATIAADALQLAGYAVFRDGTFLQLPHITLEVADSCSGLNQMVSSIALGIPIAFTFLNLWWKRLIIIFLSIFLGLVMNWIRVFLISTWHYDSAKESIHGPYGIYELPFIFLVGVFITLVVAMALSEKTNARTGGDQEVITGAGAKLAGNPNTTQASIVAIVLLAITALYLNTWKARIINLEGGLTDFPMEISGFQGVPLDRLEKPFYTEIAHSELLAKYTNEAGEVARVYIGYFHSQNQQQELVDYRYNWLHEDAESFVMPSSSLTLKSSRLRYQGRNVVVFFAYDINGRNIIDPRMAKLVSLFDALVSRRSNGAIIMVIFDDDMQNLSVDEQAFLSQVMEQAAVRVSGR